MKKTMLNLMTVVAALALTASLVGSASAISPQPVPPPRNFQVRALGPQPEPPDNFLRYRAINPQPEPPGSNFYHRGFNPQPEPPVFHSRPVPRFGYVGTRFHHVRPVRPIRPVWRGFRR